MPRYYFHLSAPDSKVTDDEGLILPDREAAWYQAVRSAREMIRAELHMGTSWEGQAIEIADDAGAPVDRVPLADIAGYAL